VPPELDALELEVEELEEETPQPPPHTPFEQAGPQPPHTLPHAPQFFRSSLTLTHFALHHKPGTGSECGEQHELQGEMGS
jgi:hypothetical protein